MGGFYLKTLIATTLIWSFFYVTLISEFSKAENNPKNRPITKYGDRF